MRLIKDSSGRKSWTLTLSIPAIIGITVWFMCGGIDIEVAGFHIITATKDGLQYAAAIAPWLAYLRTRSWTPAGTAGPEANGTPPA
jgi:hypothetical protein